MKKLFLAFALLTCFAVSALCQGTPPLRVKEADGSPNVSGVTTIVVSNGSITSVQGKTIYLTTGGGGGGGITIGTTTITSGTNTRVLYNNAGVVGEYAITGTGNVVMSAAPTLTGRVSAADGLFATSVTTGTGSSAGLQVTANSLTTGNGAEFSSSSVSSGNVVSIAATGTAAASNTKTALSVSASGANATGGQTTYGARISNTSTGTSSTNIGLMVAASGGSTNHDLQVGNGAASTATIRAGVSANPGKLVFGSAVVDFYPVESAATQRFSNTGIFLGSAIQFGWSSSSTGPTVS